MQLTGNVSIYDGQHLYHHDRRKIGDCLHGQHPHICWNKGRTDTDNKNGTGKTTGKRLVPQGQEMRMLQNKNRISRHDHQRRKNLVKLGGIRDWPTPTTVKQVRSFLGFGNFYRRFISHYSELARPLNNLTKKDWKFEWTPECQNTFETLKRRFTEEPVLLMPDQTKPFQIEADASKVATGAVLTQLDTNGDRHPMAFLSKMFTETKRKYEIYDRELLGIIRALKEWRHYIQGSGHMTIVFSDHKNLTYF